MKILFMGSAAFAVPSLKAVSESGHEILEVITQPDKPAGRGMKITRCPVALAAKALNLKLYQPPSVKKPDAIEHIRSLNPDLIVVVAYGKILPNEILEIPPLGSINLHASLLPKYRGAAPINWAIINGETETGVTTQMITEELDAGDVLLSLNTKIDEIEKASELYDRLSILGADLLVKTIAELEKGSIKPAPQDPSKVTLAPILKKEDGHINWAESAEKIYNRIRGLTPWPGTFTLLDGKMLRIHEAGHANTKTDLPVGSVIEGQDFAVACGEGVLYLIEVQLEGKRRMAAKDFLRGHKISKGTILK